MCRSIKTLHNFKPPATHEEIRASSLQFVPAGPIDVIQRMGGASGSATGDMAAEFIGLDFGL